MRLGAMAMRSSERGVALVTVLLIGAVMTVTASTAAFVTINEFNAGGADRRAAAALAVAESGIDRLIMELRRGANDWERLNEAGCRYDAIKLPQGVLADGETYDVLLTAYTLVDESGNPLPPEDRIPPLPWSSGNDSLPVCTSRIPSPKPNDNPNVHLFAITSTGNRPAAKRVVRQILRIEATPLPVGVFAESIDGNGSVRFQQMSFVSPGDIRGRDKIALSGYDPYYTMGDFYGSAYSTADPANCHVTVISSCIPAAVHALGSVYCVSSCGGSANNKREHPPSPNCQANGTGGTAGQSLWDGSSDGGEFAASQACSPRPSGTIPPRSSYTLDDYRRTVPRLLTEREYQVLRETARTTGLYCTPTTCTKAGSAPFTFPQHITDTTIAGLPNSFIAYFDFPAGSTQTVSWQAVVQPCSDTGQSRSVVVAVRNGNLEVNKSSGTNEAVGAFLVPQGTFEASGFTIHGTIMAKEFYLRGNALFKNSSCWVTHMPGALLDYTPTRWHEVDR